MMMIIIRIIIIIMIMRKGIMKIRISIRIIMITRKGIIVKIITKRRRNNNDSILTFNGQTSQYQILQKLHLGHFWHDGTDSIVSKLVV